MLTAKAMAAGELHRTDPSGVELLDVEHDAIPYDRMVCPFMDRVARKWEALPRTEGERLPPWSAFSPQAFKTELTRLCVLQAEDWRADRIEFTLYGAHPTDFIGGGKALSMQAMRASAALRANYEDIRDRAGRAIDRGLPQYARKTMSWASRGYIEYEVLMLPFAPTGDGRQRLLQPASAWLGSHPL